MDELRKHYSPERLIGRLAFLAGLVADASPRSAESLIGSFEMRGIPAVSALTV